MNYFNPQLIKSLEWESLTPSDCITDRLVNEMKKVLGDDVVFTTTEDIINNEDVEFDHGIFLKEIDFYDLMSKGKVDSCFILDDVDYNCYNTEYGKFVIIYDFIDMILINKSTFEKFSN